MKNITKKTVCLALALTFALSVGNFNKIESKATNFDINSVGGTGANSIPAWKMVNNDVVGWLKVPNTNINWPVTVKPYKEMSDYTYYLDRDYFKSKDKNGVVYADSDTKFGDKKSISRNTIFYAHNWTNYSATPKKYDPTDIMFAQLNAFQYLDVAQKTPYIHYSTEDASMTWKVFATFYTETGFTYYISDPDDKAFMDIVDTAKRKSLHDYDVDVNKDDKIITLSTCTRAYGNTDKQRFVVMARLMRDGEKIEEFKITENPDFEKPKM